MSNYTGRAWKFGDGITTDHISSGRYFHLRTNLPELAKHTLEDARADFASNVRKGDFIVAGKNLGMGSSREHAPIVIKLCGVSAVIAKSFARIFYRNCINIGLPVITCDTDQINDGDILEVRLLEGQIIDRTRNIILTFPPISPSLMAILNEGGLIPYVKKYGDIKLAVWPSSKISC